MPTSFVDNTLQKITKTKKSAIVLFALFILVILVDRYFWAQIAQWREDQATNIWLGYTIFGLSNTPVGLMSSRLIPNPNGMVILGYFLSYLPDLLSVSFFLGAAQIGLLFLIALIFSKREYGRFLIVFVPTTTAIVLRSTSIEFWNQYLMTFINLFFILFMIMYLRNPSMWIIPFVVALICIAPSLYLAGVVNSIVMALLTLGVVLYKKPVVKKMLPVLLLSLLVVLISIFLTWEPYLKNVTLLQIFNKTTGDQQGAINILDVVWRSFLKFPVYTTFQWAIPSNFSKAFFHSGDIYSSFTTLLLNLAGRSYYFQSAFAFSVFVLLIIFSVYRRLKLKIDPSAMQLTVLCGLFIIASYIFAALLGGDDWIEYVRPDQVVQFLPLSLILIFTLPSVFILDHKVVKYIALISNYSLFFFSIINLFCGFLIIKDHIGYQGSLLTDADVPLIDKMQVVEFIADDWENQSNSEIVPVDYDLGGGKWDWVSEYGARLNTWYKAPFTEGRAFDYLLKRQHNLINLQEGIQIRTFGAARYLVTYAFENEPEISGKDITHYVFGRLRVTVVEK